MDDTPLRILVVDDDVRSARILRTLLDGRGHRVRVEFDGEAALEAADEFRPEAVLLDIDMPGLRGDEVAAELRRRGGPAGREIAAITGHGPESLSRPSPFDRHFGKPIDLTVLASYLGDVRARRG